MQFTQVLQPQLNKKRKIQEIMLVSNNSGSLSIVPSKKMMMVLGRHGSDSLCRDERVNKMAATYNVLAFKR